MGHISNPISNRLGFTCFWSSNWCSFINKNYSYLLSEDFSLEDFVFWFFFSGENKFFKNNEFFLNRFFIYRSFNSLILKLNIFPLSLYGEEEVSLNFFFKTLIKNLKRKSLKIDLKKKSFKNSNFIIKKFFILSFFFKHIKFRNFTFNYFLSSNKKKKSLNNFYIKFLKKILFYIELFNKLNIDLKNIKAFLVKKKNKKIYSNFFKIKIKALTLKKFLFFKKLKLKFELLKRKKKLLIFNNNLSFDSYKELNKDFLQNLKSIKIFLNKKKSINNYNIYFYFFNIFFFNFIFKRLLYFGNFLKKNLKFLGFSKKNFFLIIQNDNFFNLKATSMAFFVRLQILQGISIQNFISNILWFLKKNPFILNFRFIISGRFSRSSRSKTKVYGIGSMPLNTFNFPVDYGISHCITKFGVCGIKIFIHKSFCITEERVFNLHYFNFDRLNIII